MSMQYDQTIIDPETDVDFTEEQHEIRNWTSHQNRIFFTISLSISLTSLCRGMLKSRKCSLRLSINRRLVSDGKIFNNWPGLAPSLV
jgi:hypothetical protein